MQLPSAAAANEADDSARNSRSLEKLTIPEPPTTPRQPRSPTRLPVPSSVQRNYDAAAGAGATPGGGGGGGGGEKRKSLLPQRPFSIASTQSLGLPAPIIEPQTNELQDQQKGADMEAVRRNAATSHARNASTGLLPPSRMVTRRQAVTTATTTSGAESSNGTNTSTTRTLRAPLQRSTSTAGSSGVRQSRTAAASEHKKVADPPKVGSMLPPPSGLGRSQSLRKPAALSGVAVASTTSRSIGLRSHGRVPSASAALSSSASSTTRGQNTSQPSEAATSEPVARHLSKGPIVGPVMESQKGIAVEQDTSPVAGLHKVTASSSSRTQRNIAAGSGTGLSRSASTKLPSRQMMSNSTATARLDATAVPPTAPKARVLGLPPPNLKSSSQPRPAFTTYQQHFSPKKSAQLKPASATIINPPPLLPSNSTVTLDLFKLQSELLHLHLLHSAAPDINLQWRESAREQLHAKFDAVATEYQDLLTDERDAKSQFNLHALQHWTSGSPSFALPENVQILGSVLHELPALTDRDSRYGHTVAEFEAWITRVQHVRQAREEDPGSGSGFIDPLPLQWKTDVTVLSRKLAALTREASRLLEPMPGSSCAALVDACSALVGGMADELRLMSQMEREVIEAERAWADKALNSLVASSNDLDFDFGFGTSIAPAAGTEAWRVS